MTRRAAVVLTVSLAAPVSLVAGGCGHPATREECEEIFRRSGEVALKEEHVEDPAVVAERVAAVREARGEELLKQCVGRRITDKAMACVRNAQTAKEMDRCLE